MRAGVLEHQSVDILNAAGVGARQPDGALVVHSNPLGDSRGWWVDALRCGADLAQSQRLERFLQRRVGAFGCVALAPVVGVQSPADLDCRHAIGRDEL